MMKHTTERKWYSWLNGVVLTALPSTWVRQKEVVMDFRRNSVDHSPLTIGNYWECTLKRISPGPPTSCHSTRRPNSAFTFSAGWKEQVSLHPSSPLSTGAPLRVCWLAASLSGMGTGCLATDRETLQRTVNTATNIIGALLHSTLDIFITRCSSKATSIVTDPTHPSHNLLKLKASAIR